MNINRPSVQKANRRIRDRKRAQHSRDRLRELKAWLGNNYPNITVEEFKSMQNFQKKQRNEEVSQEMIAELASTWKSIQAKAANRNQEPSPNRAEFFEGIQRSLHPLVEVSQSHIKNAGVGVIVSRWYPYCPPGVIYRFHGAMHTGYEVPPGDCIQLNHHTHLVLKLDHPTEEKRYYPANYVNRPISRLLRGEDYLSKVNIELYETQNLRNSNSTMTCKYVTVTEKVRTGHELLMPYGFQYRITDNPPNSLVEDNIRSSSTSEGGSDGREEEERSHKRGRLGR